MLDFATDIPATSLAGRAIRWPAQFISRGRVVRILSGPLRFQKWVFGAGLHGCWLGTYELRKQRRLSAEISPGQVVYDIGANVGFYTMLAAVRVGRTGRVFAFEPAPANLELLGRHIALNRLEQARVFPCALGAATGTSSFETSNNSFEGRLAPTGTLTVGVETLDHLLAGGEIAPAHVVKVDVEGAEFDVLRGGERFFLEAKPKLFLATHGAALHGRCSELLRSWGYQLRPLEQAKTMDAGGELLAWRE
ncbi:MAG: FkbM family methyltransferase [Verrucomicrobiales bacterium]|nr:FkbM family methyltransferase [Verrucomicrobiales bacterium]